MNNPESQPPSPLVSSNPIPKPLLITSWILQLVLAFILGQSLFFKFTAQPETVALFEVLGAEPFGRIATAIAELVCVILLLVPKTSVIGAIASVGVISGAIMAHLTKLGISIDPIALAKPNIAPLEGPGLFIMAVIVFVGGLVIIAIRRTQIPILGSKFAK
ncbi:MAG: DoxX family protein [Phycisphaerales bacterium]